MLPGAFYPANICEEQAGLAHSIQKSLTVFLHNLLTRSLGQQSRGLCLQSCGVAVTELSGVSLSSWLRTLQQSPGWLWATSGAALSPVRKAQHQTSVPFPKMGMEHKVNSCSFCLLCFKETVCFPQCRKMQDHTLLSHC